MMAIRYLTRRHPPVPPWLAELPAHPARQRIQWSSLWIWIGVPLLPLLFIPISEPAVPVFSSIILGLFSLIMFLCSEGLDALYAPSYQYCPKCYSDMEIGATRCPRCQFEPRVEESTP